MTWLPGSWPGSQQLCSRLAIAPCRGHRRLHSRRRSSASASWQYSLETPYLASFPDPEVSFPCSIPDQLMPVLDWALGAGSSLTNLYISFCAYENVRAAKRAMLEPTRVLVFGFQVQCLRSDNSPVADHSSKARDEI